MSVQRIGTRYRHLIWPGIDNFLFSDQGDCQFLPLVFEATAVGNVERKALLTGNGDGCRIAQGAPAVGYAENVLDVTGNGMRIRVASANLICVQTLVLH
jgi:hypothetical protein